MTREEVIRIAQGLIIEFKCESETMVDFCNTIIKALEQEPSGDLISRQAVLEAIEDDNRNGHYSCFASNNDAQCFKDVIRELASVNPQEPKTGHWKRISIDKYSEHAKYWYRCDRCGKDNLGNTDWCPNCGCRMFEPQESEDKE